MTLWGPILHDTVYIRRNRSRGPEAYFYSVLLVMYGIVGTESMLWYYPDRDLRLFGLLIILIVSLSDILQFIIGKNLGRTYIGGPSPNKTLEGYIGGFLVVPLSTLVLPFWYSSLLVCFGILGDLFESWCKRKIGIKDSSYLLGSHGGWFDRMDGIFMALIISQVFLG